MKDRITPVGLKGNEINERMKQLMGIQPINENKKSSAVELTKMGPDGNAYAIIRENHEYYIKISKKNSNLTLEDFSYIGGLQNKKQEAYPTYAKAIRQLNLKFNSLNEAYGKLGQINVFEDDNLIKEMSMGFTGEGNLEGNKMSECCGAQTMEGMCMECGGSAYGMGGGMEEYDKPAMDSFKDQYGDKGKNIYYATANAQDRNPETFEKNEDMGMMGEYENTDEEFVYELSDKQEKMAALAGDPDEIDAPDFAALRAGKHMENEGVGGSKMGKIMSMIAGVDSNMDTGKKPKVWVDYENENCLNLSAEDGQYFADYYGEMDGSGYPYIDPRLEAIADKFDSYWEWVNPGVVTLCLDGLDETQQAVHDMMEDEMTAKEKEFAALAPPKDKITFADKIAGATKNEGKLSIERAINEMDSIIESIVETDKKKVYTLK